ncbi:MAG: helix-turn-helix transcriptional regulator [Vulcanimicrobiota bacterium]
MSGEFTKAQNMIRLLMVIMRNPKITPTEVMDYLSISKDQYYRYFNELTHLLPIYYDREKRSYEINNLADLPDLIEDSNKLYSLLLVLHLLDATKVENPRNFQQLKKMMGISPEIESIFKYCVGVERFPHHEEFLDKLAEIYKAIFFKRIITFSYSKQKEVIEKIELEPYRLVHDRDWYVRGYNPYKKEKRTYKISRMKNVEITQDSFNMPAEVEVSVINTPWDFENTCTQEVEILFDSSLEQYLNEQHFHPSQKLEETRDGNILFKVVVKTPEHMIPWIISHRKLARIIKPEWLKDKLLEELDKIKGVYTK